MEKRSFSGKALSEDIKGVLSDAELTHRYDLQTGELKKLLIGLVKAGYVTQEDLDARKQREPRHLLRVPATVACLTKAPDR